MSKERGLITEARVLFVVSVASILFVLGVLTQSSQPISAGPDDYFSKSPPEQAEIRLANFEELQPLVLFDPGMALHVTTTVVSVDEGTSRHESYFLFDEGKKLASATYFIYDSNGALVETQETREPSEAQDGIVLETKSSSGQVIKHKKRPQLADVLSAASPEFIVGLGKMNRDTSLDRTDAIGFSNDYLDQGREVLRTVVIEEATNVIVHQSKAEIREGLSQTLTQYDISYEFIDKGAIPAVAPSGGVN